MQDELVAKEFDEKHEERFKSIIARIVNFRGGRRTHYTNQMILELNDEFSSRENLVKLMGKKVIYRAKTHNIIGKITRIHGKRGVVARFNRGIPGQAIGDIVEIVIASSSKSE